MSQIKLQAVVNLAGRQFTTQGFKVCGSCGKVMGRSGSPDHMITCKWRDKPEQAKAIDVLYLYREFASESIRFLMPDEKFWQEGGLNSFIASLQLGLKQKFGGKVDHLRTAISEEPQPSSTLRKSFLYLYDSIPGGTGYLRQLIRRPSDLKEVFDQALQLLRACDCADGCYNCLFAYRNSFNQNGISRRLAQTQLAAIDKHWSQLQEHSQGLSAIRINSNFDSELERRFIEAIRRYNFNLADSQLVTLRKEIVNRRSGYYLQIGEVRWEIETQVSLGATDGIEIPARADFVLRPASSRSTVRPIAIFTDGWEYHQERLSQDFQQRTAILRSGDYLCWSLTWDDVAAQIDPNKVVERPNGLVHGSNLPMEQIYQQYQCTALQKLESSSSFEWLMAFLADPQTELWERWALLQTAAHQPISNAASLPPAMFDQLSQGVLDRWEPPAKFLVNYVEVSPLLQAWYAIDPQRHQQQSPDGSLVLLRLDDNQPPVMLRPSWVEALRLLNLYQFLRHLHVLNAKDPVVLDVTSDRGQQQSLPLASDDRWEAVCQLVLEDLLLPSLELMAAENWPLPEAGMDLANGQGQVLGFAELAWLEAKMAIVTTPEDKIAFTDNQWFALEVAEFLSSIEIFKAKLMGAN